MGVTNVAVTELLGGALGGGGLVKFLSWVLSRKSGHLKMLYDQLDRADKRLERHETRMDEMDTHLAECRDHKELCEKDLAEIRRLMGGPVASYGGGEQ